MSAQMMEFPNTFDEFANEYGLYDKDEVYTNGAQLIPVFRVKQWLDHCENKKSITCSYTDKEIAESFISDVESVDDKNFGYDDYKKIRETITDLIVNEGYTIEMIKTVIEQNFEK